MNLFLFSINLICIFKRNSNIVYAYTPLTKLIISVFFLNVPGKNWKLAWKNFINSIIMTTVQIKAINRGSTFILTQSLIILPNTAPS